MQRMTVAMWRFISILKDWQDLAAGILGFGGAIWAIAYTAKSDRDKYRREVLRAETEDKALRQALGVELRDIAANVLKYYKLVQPAPGPGETMTVADVRQRVRFVEPVIYKQNAGRIAVVGRRASAVVAFYSKVEFCADGLNGYREDQQQWSFPDEDRRDLARSLAGALKAAMAALLGLEPMTEVIEKQDAVFASRVEETLRIQPPPPD